MALMEEVRLFLWQKTGNTFLMLLGCISILLIIISILVWQRACTEVLVTEGTIQFP